MWSDILTRVEELKERSEGEYARKELALVGVNMWAGGRERERGGERQRQRKKVREDE